MNTGDGIVASARPAPDILITELHKRVLSAVALAPPVLAAVWFGPPWFDVLICGVALLLAWEWARMALPVGVSERAVSACLGITVAVAVVVFAIGRADGAFAAVAIGSVLGYLLAPANRRLWVAAGALYIGLPLLAIVWLRSDPVLGRQTVIWILGVVWAADIGAYAAGRAIGGPKLAPAISPNKTWAGLFGAVTAAGAAGAAIAWWMGTVGLFGLALASALLGLVSQGGDLLESGMKRRFKVKDSSNLIPGHGGVLDRVDALLAAAVAVAAVNIVGAGRGHVLTWW